MEIRSIKANEIDCRIGSINAKGLTLLLYKDARVDQNILDETYGAMNWKRSHQLIGNNLYCTVSIYDESKGEWISKQDVGTESYTEKEKGQASDSFKRACFNWGIGRELYTAPFIYIPSTKCNIVQRNGKDACYDKFYVKSLKVENGKITYCEIAIKDKGTVYTYQEAPKSQSKLLRFFEENNLDKTAFLKANEMSSFGDKGEVWEENVLRHSDIIKEKYKKHE